MVNRLPAAFQYGRASRDLWGAAIMSLDVQCVSKRAQRRLLDRFAQGRVRMNRSGNVLEPSAHFDGLGKRRAQFRHPRPHGLPSQNQMVRSEEHTSELQSLMRISYAVFC